MLRGPLSHPICRRTVAFCRVLSAIQSAPALQSCPLSAHSNRCVISFHGCLSRQTALDTSSSIHGTSRSGHTPRLKYHVLASPQHVATYQVDLPVFNFSSWKVTFPQFRSFNRLFCARRINATREPLFQKLARRNNATPLLLCDIKRRSNANPPAHISGTTRCLFIRCRQIYKKRFPVYQMGFVYQAAGKNRGKASQKNSEQLQRRARHVG